MARKRPDEDDDESLQLPRPHSSERLLMEHFPVSAEGRVLCTSLGRGQLAAGFATVETVEEVHCWFVDQYRADSARDALEMSEVEGVEVHCSPDLPEGTFDLIAVPVSHRGEAEFVRETLQQAALRLKPGGRLVAGVDNPTDSWLHGELRKLAKKVRRDPHHHGVVYAATIEGPPKRIRNFRCELGFRDRDRMVKAVTRPGVFSHRELDQGARALLEAAEVQPGDRILDLGCGSGVVGLALALRQPGTSLHGIDSNARAVQCLLEGAPLNELTQVTATLTAEGEVGEAGTFDLAVGNPPYYSRFEIAEIFVQAAKRGLKPGGRVVMVTRKPEWFVARFSQLFRDVEERPGRAYTIVSGRQRGG